MRKLLLYFFAIVAPIVSVNAAEPDTSDLTSLQDVFEVLDSQPVTYLDLKLERASRILNAQKNNCIEDTEFEGLYWIRKGEYQITKEGKLICLINLSREDLSPILQQKLDAVKKLYDTTLKLAKKYIHDSVNDYSFVVVMTSTTFYWKNGEQYSQDRNELLDVEEKQIVKIENGRPTYYNQFFVGIIDL